VELWQALVESRDHVCARYRLHPFLPVFQSRGSHLELISFPASLWGRIHLNWTLGGSPLIIQRKLLPTWQTRLVRMRTRTLIFDFDDAVFLRDSYHPKGFHDGRRLRRFRRMVRAADYVVAGNHYLAAEARKWRIPEDAEKVVRVIPTCIDLSRYPLQDSNKRNSDGAFRLVWIGSSSTLQGIEDKSALWKAIGQNQTGARLRVICDRFPRFDGLEVEPRTWSSASEALHLAEADVGVSWIPDDPWSRGKCGLKVLQYMAAGLPVVANPVGVHLEMVRPHITGFLPQSESEWVEAVDWLRRHPAEAQAMGRRGREIAEKEYSIQAGAKAWNDLLGLVAMDRSQREAA
jgi:glycosyltransferase involved in cell wall biosynthesis